MHHASQPGPALTHESEKRCALFFESAPEGFAYCRMLYDAEGRPDDFVYLAVNPAFERLTGLKDVVGKRFTEIVPTAMDETSGVLGMYGGVVDAGESAEFEIDFAPFGLLLHVSARRPEPGHFITVFTDITERDRADVEFRRLNHELEGRMVTRTAELAASNKENDELVNETATLVEDNAAITRIAATDGLTGLANRRRFREALGQSASFARRHGSALAVVSLDLDGLKSRQRQGRARGRRPGADKLRFAACRPVPRRRPAGEARRRRVQRAAAKHRVRRRTGVRRAGAGGGALLPGAGGTPSHGKRRGRRVEGRRLRRRPSEARR